MSRRRKWEGRPRGPENKLAEAQDLNDSLRHELDRLRDDRAAEVRDLGNSSKPPERLSPEEEWWWWVALRSSSRRTPTSARRGGEQQQVTEEVRHEARTFVQEMKLLSQQSSTAWERQSEMEKTIDSSRARSATGATGRPRAPRRSLRSMGASPGLPAEHDAAVRQERGFTDGGGLVKDVHVTKFQISVDELLRAPAPTTRTRWSTP